VLGFLAVNATAYLASYSLTVAPIGNLAQRVYLIKRNITDSNIYKHLALVTSKPACYNVIFLIYVFKTISLEQRCSLLKRLKGMLVLGSYIIVSISACFTDKIIISLEL
jgi:hypothetical protein